MQRNSRLRKLAKEEDGFSLVFVGLGFMAFLGVCMLAIDVGMLMTARSQAQNSADAGALAGATALVFNDWNDRSASGPAVTNAVNAALGNQVMSGNVNVTPADVVFLADASGQNDQVQVTVHRDSSRGNAIDTMIAQYFGIRTVGVNATATAEASPADTETCVKPFTIPDRWREVTSPPFDPNTSTFDMYDNKGNLLSPADVYIGPDDAANYTGYNADKDKGLEIILKADNGTKIAPSFYYPWDMPLNGAGAADYNWNIGNCNTTLMKFGDIFPPKPGDMTGPTAQGIQQLINLDLSATWDTVNNRISSTMSPSPRLVAIPLFDPVYYAQGIQQGRNASLKFVNYLGFFIEDMQGNTVRGRITPIGGLRQGGTPAPAGAFPRSIRLVR